MNLFHYVIDRLVFAAGLIAGSQVPAFVVQYRQYLGGRIAQLNEDLALFQQIADRYFNGELQALITHHISSDDAAFRAEGFALQQMIDQQQTLTAIFQQLQAAFPKQIMVLLQNWNQQMIADTWHSFQPAIVGTMEAIIVALMTGFLFAFIYQLCKKLIALSSRRLMHLFTSD